VQSLIDQRKALRFLLTGSSARKLKRGNANLLPGRLFWYRLYSLTFWELKQKFDLERALTIGTLPEIYLETYGADLLQNYVNTYIREEIQAEAITRSIASFERFIDLAAECSGQIVNYSSLASDSEIPKETIRRFYQVLVDTLLVHRISNYQALRPHRKAAQKDMYIFFDMGIRNAILGRQKNKFSQEELGKLFEQWFICQVIAYNEYAQKGWTIHYYRDDAKNEVDLVIEQAKRIIAVEVKLSKSFKPSFTKGLHAIAESSKKPVQQYLVYCGTERQARETIKVEPFGYFLSEILPKL
jgi:predicted AAA+ superfamily ATPase